MAGATYFDLVKDCLVEMFYEEPKTWADTNTTEGIKVKRLLNQELKSIVLGENIPWKFRQRKQILPLVAGVNKYCRPNGYIIDMRYPVDDMRLFYNQHNIYLPINTEGQPMMYWFYEGLINLFPTPSEKFAGRDIVIRYLTNDCAKDKYGVGKEQMVEEDDEPIIPEQWRDILVYAVCRDFRRSLTDNASTYYERRFRETYRALLSDQKLGDDYPDGFDIAPWTETLQDVILNVYMNPRVGGYINRWQA